MTTFDLRPLFQTTVGFDHLANMFNAMDAMHHKQTNYPPYNIIKLGENTYKIVMAVAGFAKEDLSVVLHENDVTIKTISDKAEEEGLEYLHRGIANRAFEKKFQLADFIQVRRVNLQNGLLEVFLERIVPDEMQPREILIEEGPDAAPKSAQKPLPTQK